MKKKKKKGKKNDWKGRSHAGETIENERSIDVQVMAGSIGICDKYTIYYQCDKLVPALPSWNGYNGGRWTRNNGQREGIGVGEGRLTGSRNIPIVASHKTHLLPVTLAHCRHMPVANPAFPKPTFQTGLFPASFSPCCRFVHVDRQFSTGIVVTAILFTKQGNAR